MTVFCIECSKWDLRRGATEIARIGFGACAHQDAYIGYFGEKDRDCGKFVAAKQEDIEARRAWLLKVKNGAGVRQVLEGRT